MFRRRFHQAGRSQVSRTAARLVVGIVAAVLTTTITLADYVQQDDFYTMIERFRTQYRSAPTPLQKTNYRIQRRDEMCSRFPRAVEDWAGIVAKVSSDYDGNATLSVIAGKDLLLKTSDEIKRRDPIFEIVLALKPNDLVRFSGSFFPDGSNRDCFRESSFTEKGGMNEPEFAFTFTRMEKTGSR